ncbi:MAG TPA: hypothetical protein VNA16_03260, partial [Abditibacteriaceae bacterium]|nr:hypothetical protein [Abditibacteriaceae bacterium]
MLRLSKTLMKALCSVLFVCVTTGVSKTAVADVTVVQDGVAKAAIYVNPAVMAPEDKTIASNSADPKYVAQQGRLRLQASVQDLAQYLEKMSGAKIEVMTTAPVQAKGVLPVLIGDLAI